jgi:thioredoxin-dependent peroxiredoxin
MKFHPFVSTFAITLGLVVFAHAEPLAVGAPAPETSAMNQDAKPVIFTDIYAKGPTLVYFFPKADTPGCTRQACSIRDDWAALQARGIQVLGVSEDEIVAQKQFQDKYNLPFPLIADHHGKVAKAFGVDMRGTVTARQSFLIKDGKIVWNMLNGTTTETHAKDVLAAYELLSKK